MFRTIIEIFRKKEIKGEIKSTIFQKSEINYPCKECVIPYTICKKKCEKLITSAIKINEIFKNYKTCPDCGFKYINILDKTLILECSNCKHLFFNDGKIILRHPSFKY